jgi:hypothetical protein
MIAETPYPLVHGIEAQLIARVKALVQISSIISRKTLSDDPHHRDTQQTGHSRCLVPGCDGVKYEDLPSREA